MTTNALKSASTEDLAAELAARQKAADEAARTEAAKPYADILPIFDDSKKFTLSEMLERLTTWRETAPRVAADETIGHLIAMMGHGKSQVLAAVNVSAPPIISPPEP